MSKFIKIYNTVKESLDSDFSEEAITAGKKIYEALTPKIRAVESTITCRDKNTFKSLIEIYTKINNKNVYADELYNTEKLKNLEYDITETVDDKLYTGLSLDEAIKKTHASYEESLNVHLEEDLKFRKVVKDFVDELKYLKLLNLEA